MLTIDRISAGYKIKGRSIPVLQNFSLTVQKGKVLAVLGPSGCGKSTLIQTLAGMLAPDAGTVRIDTDGESKPLSPLTHNIAVIPQNCGLLPWKTVRRNCLLPLKLHHLSVDKPLNDRLEEICGMLGMRDYLDRFPGELSGGQVRRAALARAFLQTPDLLLMDEPFSSLDAITCADAWRLFLAVWRQKQPTTLLVTHSLQEALLLGHEIIVLGRQNGEILALAQNPYFGQEEADGTAYIQLRHSLHELLRPSDREVAR